MAEKEYFAIKDVIGGVKAWTKEGAAKSREYSTKGKTTAITGTIALASKGDLDASRLLNVFLVAVVAILLCDRMGVFVR